MTTNQAVCGLIPKPNYRYFNYVQLATSVASLANLARGSAQQNISKGIVETTKTVLPDDGVLRAFDAALDPILEKWVANLKANMALGGLRDTLLPKLISGELRVPSRVRGCPMTYEHQGRQYIVFAVADPDRPELVALALPQPDPEPDQGYVSSR